MWVLFWYIFYVYAGEGNKYNERVVECRLAANIIAKAMGLEYNPKDKVSLSYLFLEKLVKLLSGIAVQISDFLEV